MVVPLFVISAFGGSLMSLAINSPNMISVGASGAIMGLLASAFIFSCRLPFHAGGTKMQMLLMQLLIPSLLPLASHIHGQRVDFAAHFGGLISGVVMGWIVIKFWPKDSPTPKGQSASHLLKCWIARCFIYYLYDHPCLSLGLVRGASLRPLGDAAEDSNAVVYASGRVRL